MNKFTEKITGTLKRGGMSFSHYPASMVFAALLAILSIWLIHQRPDETKIYEAFVFAFLIGIFAGIAFVVIAKKISSRKIFFIAANLDAFLAVIITFFVLYLPVDEAISEIAMLRVLAAVIVLFLIFLTVPTFKGDLPDFNMMFFMTLKSFFISLVYGLVLMLGSFFVAFSVQSLLYEDMSNKVYSYIAILTGFVSYAFFLGYFPEFDNDTDEGKQEVKSASTQPKFAKVLFQNILIPIMAALTVVLLIWSLRILITGNWPEYNQVIAIFTTYSISGIVLYYLVSSFDQLIVKVYRKVFPVAAILFLVFEVFPILERIAYYGVKPFEYAIVFTWVFALISCITFILLPVEKNKITALIAMVLVSLFVSPLIGAYDFSHRSQVNHLEKILLENEMLDNNKITLGFDVDKDDKIRITSAVEFLFYESQKQQPEFLKQSLKDMVFFRQTFGFEPAYEWEYLPEPKFPGDFEKIIYFTVAFEPVLIEQYSYHIPFKAFTYSSEVQLETENGIYLIEYMENYNKNEKESKLPELKISLNGQEIFLESFDDFVSEIRADYADAFSDRSANIELSPEEIKLIWETDDLRLMVLFNSLSISEKGNTENYFDISGIYIYFK